MTKDVLEQSTFDQTIVDNRNHIGLFEETHNATDFPLPNGQTDEFPGPIDQVEQTPFAKEQPERKEQQKIEILKTKRVAKRNFIDKTIVIDDKDLKKQIRHESKRPKLPLDLSVRSELMLLNHFNVTNREVFRGNLILTLNSSTVK
jgi:hypothetical protein